MPLRSFQCGDCNKVRVETRFSKSSIRKHEDSVRAAERKARDQRYRRKGTNNQENDKPVNLENVVSPRCMECTGGNIHELKCAHCSVTKGLEDFSKQMRKDPDNALCLNCSQDRQDIEPEHRDQVIEEDTIEKLRAGATPISLGTGSTAIGYAGNSRTMGRSNGPSASTEYDAASNWMQPPIPVPDDPRAEPDANGSRSPSNVSDKAYTSNASAVSKTSWANFERTNAPYRERMAYRSSSNSTGSRGGGNPDFVKQKAVKQDVVTKAQNSLARQQLREAEQAEQAAHRESDDEDSDSDSDPY